MISLQNQGRLGSSLSWIHSRGFNTEQAVANLFLTLGSSRGRGKRAAGWFADYIEEQGDKVMRSFTLDAGIIGWAHAGKEYVELMDGY